MTQRDRTNWAGMLDIVIDADSATPISRQVFLRVREAIIDRSLPHGSHIPSSRELGVRLGVSRTAVITAYDELRAEGLLEGRHGSGTYVTHHAEKMAGV